MLRLFIDVIFGITVAVLVLIGVEVAVAGTFSDSESVSSETVKAGCFLASGAISFNISFWFSAKILVRSDIIFF